ncbi:hypothetical protein N7463_008002 [Penicillium fimorum]|uniref:Uncharacterized protein n=1 Tax=Penicillium fimorum TaxID=1882269 RepID=A0A9X0C7J8_9EURO|nr:hypothetical protein N7463_008002 [Penicillium fimorum]
MSNSSISQASLQSFNQSYDHVEYDHGEDIHTSLQEMEASVTVDDHEQVPITIPEMELGTIQEMSNRLRAALGIPVAQENDDSIDKSEEEVCEQYKNHVEEDDESPEEDELEYEQDSLNYEDAFSYEGDLSDY